MVAGIGTDITEVARVKKACEKEAFLAHVFTENERKNSGWPQRKSWAESLAGDFEAKEAVAKALGTGFCGFGTCDIEIGRDLRGAPLVCLYGGAKDALRRIGGGKILVSISHERAFAVAFAVIESERQEG